MRIPKRLLLAAAVGATLARRALTPPYDLSGKVTLVTGGSRGLGLALAQELLTRGARVTLMARTEADLHRAQASLNAPGRVSVVAGDVTQAADLDRAVAETVRAHGRLDVLINNAGIIQVGPLANTTEADFRQSLEVNALAPLRLVRAALPHLRGGGRVVIVSSLGGKVAVPHLAPYSVSKFAAAGLGQALRAELAREGVTVTTVLPGLMRTGSPRNAPIKGQQAREYTLFATLDNLPGLTLDAHEAARRIVTALVRGDAEATIGAPAWLLSTAQALAPQLTADLLALGSRLLPGPGRTTQAVTGHEVETALTRANPLKSAAEAEFNQKPAGQNGGEAEA
ncbi:SDR family NAD(P)-dependent oxidoreductase [Deinococcus sp. HMF7604]|uniref:SDR family NAD(P)-dependent oxidoreductase n=1 Tax=Deinococcus betulae TaxID=2873312 RepID=UPI001CC96B26|nr:SDR family NAD(P)-dependent oxidoreductase [Deinococcus betulae]MBZ9750923.1 SDR family NAD(P)-dependent oxidoreductase [Deinococcus betulae]